VTTTVELPPVIPGRALSILIHADTKVGKSTFGNTAPWPRLLLDVEAAYRFLPQQGNKRVFWDPLTESCPRWDGVWELCVVKVVDYGTFLKALEWLKSGHHDFRSVVIDSISELQVKCKENLTDGPMKIQLWGDLLTHMERACRDFRDLTEHPTRPLECVVLTAMTEHRDGKWRPYLQGKINVKAPYFFDVIGYLFVQATPDPSGDPTKPPVKIRRMLIGKDDNFESGERVQGRLPDVLDNPTIPMMLDTVFGATTGGTTQ
jgi:hypothetical protein